MRTSKASLTHTVEIGAAAPPKRMVRILPEEPLVPLREPRESDEQSPFVRERRIRRRTLLFALGFSVTFHGILLLGLNTKKPAAAAIEDAPMAMTLIKLPEIPEDPDETTAELESSEEVAEGVDVPRQADVPTSVVLSSMFTQRFDPRSLQPSLNLKGTHLLTIPTNIRPGGAGGHGLKEIFNIADLDRPPTAVFQPTPVIPAGLRQEGTRIKLMLEFIVDSKGNVVDVKVNQSSDDKFNDAAIRGVMKWRFKPGMKKGHYVASRVIQPMIISISNAIE